MNSIEQSSKRLRGGLLLVTILGGVGGIINAWLCFARIPVPVGDDPGFEWMVLPGGALHGAVLAVIPVWAAFALSTRSTLRLLFVPLVGWVAGYISWIPLERWVMEESWEDSFLWLFPPDSWTDILWRPFAFFGLVSLILYLLLSVSRIERAIVHFVACGVCAGVLGSLWWWVSWEPWYFALIHGTIWGAFVGLGLNSLTSSLVGVSK